MKKDLESELYEDFYQGRHQKKIEWLNMSTTFFGLGATVGVGIGVFGFATKHEALEEALLSLGSGIFITCAGLSYGTYRLKKYFQKRNY